MCHHAWLNLSLPRDWEVGHVPAAFGKQALRTSISDWFVHVGNIGFNIDYLVLRLETGWMLLAV